MIYSIHAWKSDDEGECFRNFTADPTDPVLAVIASTELLLDNPEFTLVMIRMWYKVVRFDHELGAIQFIRIPGHEAVTVRVNRLRNLLKDDPNNRVYRPEVFIADRQPIMVQLEYNSPQDVINNRGKLMPYLSDDPPQIIIPFK